MPHPLDALEHALNEERQALLSQDAERLLGANQQKLDALAAIEKIELGPESSERVMALSQLNRSNSVLLSRRRREVNWALSHLGIIDADGIYTADGTRRHNSQLRYFGTG